jgi:hypothetical protein
LVASPETHKLLQCGQEIPTRSFCIRRRERYDENLDVVCNVAHVVMEA